MKYILLLLLTSIAFANPYPNPNKVPFDIRQRTNFKKLSPVKNVGSKVLRIQLDYSGKDRFVLNSMTREFSGTKAFIRKSKNLDPHGSYRGVLKRKSTGEILAYDSIGTGSYYRHLARSITFRFPYVDSDVELDFYRENPDTGVMEHYFTWDITLENIKELTTFKSSIRLVREAKSSEYMTIGIYADGYKKNQEDKFFRDVQKIVDTFERTKFPEQDKFRFIAYFHPSKEEIGKAKTLGHPIPEKDSFLGLYFPYWEKFGRWYNIVYPTREGKYRDGIGQMAYDYPIVLINDSAYWGVGNYKVLTAIPSDNSSFSYLLLHEFGHYLGLNEEYNTGGATELAFSPGVSEPWSPNITFLKDPKNLKWKDLVDAKTPIPTPKYKWGFFKKRIGAYKGGYAQTEPLGHSHKPGFACRMASGKKFCPVCREAIKKRIDFDMGKVSTLK